MKNLLPIILIVVAIAGYSFYIRPQYDILLSTQALEKQYVDALDKSQELVDLYNELSDKYNKFSVANLQRLDSVVPETSNNVRLVLDISEIALSHGIVIRAVKTSDTTVRGNVASIDSNLPPDSHIETNVSFTFKSSYEKAVAFAEDLERSLRIMDIRSITLLPNKNEYDFTLSLVAYSISSMN